MKNIFLILSLCLFSCSNSDIKPELFEVDSVLLNSEQHLVTYDSIQKKSDSTTKEQVIKLIREFKYLTKEI